MTGIRRRPEAVIFDWDSTLVDNWGAIARSLNATLARMGHRQWSMEEVRRQTKLSAREAFPALFGGRWRVAERYFYDQFAEFHLEEMRPLPGAERVLRLLQDHDVPVSVVSNKAGGYLRAEAQVLGWASYFVRIVGATDAERDKPAPDAVYKALDGTGVAAGKTVWFVGDSVVDLRCAHATRCLPLLLEGGAITGAEIAAWPPVATLSSHDALAACFLHCAPA